MNITVLCKRSDDWVHDARLRTGENVPEEVAVTIPVSDFCIDVRGYLLEYNNGTFPLELRRVQYTSDYIASLGAGFGSVPINVGRCESPRVEDVEVAIIDAFTRVKARRGDFEETQLRNEQHALELDKARHLLADDLQSLKDRLAGMTEKRDLLSRFLTHIDSEALRDAVSRWVTESHAAEPPVDELMARIEAATPHCIFGM